jgi:DNA-binding IclR family transcriptional regulator
MNEQASTRQGVNSIEVGVRLLKVLTSLGRPATLTEIATVAKMHPAKAHRYLVSFIRSGLVAQNSHDSLYSLGPYALEFSVACLSQLDVVKMGLALLEPLAEETNETVFAAVWGTFGPTVIDWQPSRRSLFVSTHTGRVFPLLMSSTGRIFAAYMDRSVIEPLIDKELEQLASTGDPLAPKSRAEVADILDEVREHGLSRGIGIRSRGVSSFSAPVFDFRGQLWLALTAVGYEDTFDSDWGGPVAAALRRSTHNLWAQAV